MGVPNPENVEGRIVDLLIGEKRGWTSIGGETSCGVILSDKNVMSDAK